MANNVIFIFKAIDKYTAVARGIASSTDTLRSKMGQLSRSFQNADKRFSKSIDRLKRLKQSLSDVGSAITTRVSLPIAALGGLSLRQSAKIETLTVAFTTLIGNAELAKKTLSDLTTFAAKTPFQLEELTAAGKQLLSFGVKAEDLVPTLKMLGELAAGTGKPITEFSLIFGQVMGKGRLQGEEMLQLAEKGISIQSILAKKFKVDGKTISDAVSKGQVSFKMFEEALKEVTGEGGKFNGLTEKLSGTLGGLTSTLRDSVNMALKEMGDTIVEQANVKEIIKDITKGIEFLTKKIVAFSKAHPQITKFVIIFGAILVVLGPVLMVVGNLVLGFGALTLVTMLLGTTVWGLLAPFLAIIAVIGLVITAAVMLWTRWDKVVAGFKLAIEDLPSFFKWVFSNVFDVLLSVHNKIVELTMQLGEEIRRAIGDAIGAAIDFALAKLKAMSDKVLGFINKIADKINAFKSSVGDLKDKALDSISGAFEFGSGNITATSKSTADINLNIASPRGVVKSVKSTTSGRSANLNLGVNMMEVNGA